MTILHGDLATVLEEKTDEQGTDDGQDDDGKQSESAEDVQETEEIQHEEEEEKKTSSTEEMEENKEYEVVLDDHTLDISTSPEQEELHPELENDRDAEKAEEVVTREPDVDVKTPEIKTPEPEVEVTIPEVNNVEQKADLSVVKIEEVESEKSRMDVHKPGEQITEQEVRSAPDIPEQEVDLPEVSDKPEEDQPEKDDAKGKLVSPQEGEESSYLSLTNQTEEKPGQDVRKRKNSEENLGKSGEKPRENSMQESVNLTKRRTIFGFKTYCCTIL